MRKAASREPGPPAMPQGAGDGAIAEAARRLELALQRLETSGGVSDPAADSTAVETLAQNRVAEHSRVWAEERAALDEQLRRAKQREQALQQVATLASQAIGRATAEVRAALGGESAHNGAVDGDLPQIGNPAGGGLRNEAADRRTEENTPADMTAADEEAA